MQRLTTETVNTSMTHEHDEMHVSSGPRKRSLLTSTSGLTTQFVKMTLYSTKLDETEVGGRGRMIDTKDWKA